MKSQTIPFLVALAMGVLFGSSLASCNQSKEPDEKTRTALMEKGKRISSNLSGALLAKLSSEIQENGITEAIQYCSVNALPITDSISKAEQVKISRISHRNRNPLNAANSEEIELIKKYISQIETAGALTPTIVTRDNKHTYYAPIVIAMPTCLKCHGKPDTDIDAQVMSTLNTIYPEDKATGFEMGELRGLFKIEFEKGKSSGKF